jgi:hypothetical protein
MHPLRLKADSSATSRTFPQRGHFGRPRFEVAASSVLQANWMLIVDLLDAPANTPNLTLWFVMLRAICGAAATPL